MTYYHATVGVKGSDPDVEALRLFLDQALEGKSSSKAVNKFFSENGINGNPLHKGGREFQLPGDDDECADGTGDPAGLYAGLASAFPRLEFFCWAALDNDNGNGVEYQVYKNGAGVDRCNDFYDGDDYGGYTLTHIPADACQKWVQAKYAFWRIADNGDPSAVAAAEGALEKAREKLSGIAEFMTDGGFNDLDMHSNTLKVNWGDVDFEVLRLVEAEGGYEGYSITRIETIVLNPYYSEDDAGWDELPDLRGFTGLKTLNITGCPRITRLPPYITEKVKAGTLEVIGFGVSCEEADSNADDSGDDSDDSDSGDDSDDSGINSEEDALAFARERPEDFLQIPEEYRTREVCLAAITDKGGVCGYVPESVQSEAFFLEAVKVNQNGKALKYIPGAYLTEAVVNAALESHPDALDEEELIRISYEARGAENHDGAIAASRKALELKPNYDAAWNSLAYAYLGKKDYARAVEAVGHAIKIDPEAAAYWDNRAEIYEAAGDYAKAVADARKALEIEPDYEDYKARLLRCEEALKKQAPGAASENLCAKCGKPHSPGAKFCPHCGSKIEPKPKARLCAKCGKPLNPGARFCGACGTKVEQK